MKTEITKVNADWVDIKNACRITVNKQESDKDATSEFKTKLMISEHSPIRLLDVSWCWKEIKSWISVHFARHWLGWDKWISTQREDRTQNIQTRDELPQGALVNYKGKANGQALINVARYRLCKGCPHPETRRYMEDLKSEIEKTEPEVAKVMVPNCIYRCGCPEFKPCGWFMAFVQYCNENKVDIYKISDRYDAYDKFVKDLHN